MTTSAILGTHEQSRDQHEYLFFRLNRIHDRNIGSPQADQEVDPGDISRHAIHGRPNIEL